MCVIKCTETDVEEQRIRFLDTRTQTLIFRTKIANRIMYTKFSRANNKCNRISQLLSITTLITISYYIWNRIIGIRLYWIILFWRKRIFSIIHIQVSLISCQALHSKSSRIEYNDFNLINVWRLTTQERIIRKKKNLCTINHIIVRFPENFYTTTKNDQQSNIFCNSRSQTNH